MEWPIVAENDGGIRPAGAPDRCFYCDQPVGSLHGPQCVTVQKKIRARYIIEVDLDVPWHWTPEQFEFHRNEGSWCADNAIDTIQQYQSMVNEDGTCTPCLCDRFKAEFVKVLDNTPTRELNTPEQL